MVQKKKNKHVPIRFQYFFIFNISLMEWCLIFCMQVAINEQTSKACQFRAGWLLTCSRPIKFNYSVILNVHAIDWHLTSFFLMQIDINKMNNQCPLLWIDLMPRCIKIALKGGRVVGTFVLFKYYLKIIYYFACSFFLQLLGLNGRNPSLLCYCSSSEAF